MKLSVSERKSNIYKPHMFNQVNIVMLCNSICSLFPLLCLFSFAVFVPTMNKQQRHSWCLCSVHNTTIIKEIFSSVLQTTEYMWMCMLDSVRRMTFFLYCVVPKLICFRLESNVQILCICLLIVTLTFATYLISHNAEITT